MDRGRGRRLRVCRPIHAGGGFFFLFAESWRWRWVCYSYRSTIWREERPRAYVSCQQHVVVQFMRPVPARPNPSFLPLRTERPGPSTQTNRPAAHIRMLIQKLAPTVENAQSILNDNTGTADFPALCCYPNFALMKCEQMKPQEATPQTTAICD